MVNEHTRLLQDAPPGIQKSFEAKLRERVPHILGLVKLPERRQTELEGKKTPKADIEISNRIEPEANNLARRWIKKGIR